jgi:hypothetical protein
VADPVGLVGDVPLGLVLRVRDADERNGSGRGESGAYADAESAEKVTPIHVACHG